MTIPVDKELIKKILEMPEAPALVMELQKALDEEKKRRIDYYNNVSEYHKSEFINGEIIIHSLVKIEHNEINGNLYKIIDTYVVEHDLGFVGIEKIMIQLTRNDYEPDLCFFKKSTSSKFKKGQTIFPAPDFIIEILSKGTAKRDRGIKYQDYEKHQVEEYWIIDAQKKTIEQYRLKKGKYELVLKSKTGEVESFAIKGLKFPIKTIFNKKLTHQFVKSL